MKTIHALTSVNAAVESVLASKELANVGYQNALGTTIITNHES